MEFQSTFLADIRHRLQGMFSTNLRGQIDHLQLELHQQLRDIKRHTEQKVFQTLHDNLQWLNPKNWFNGLNGSPWMPPSLNPYLCFQCIWRLFAQDCIWEQQIVGFTGLTTTIAFTNKKGKMLGTALPGFRSYNPPWLRLSERPWDPKPLRR